MMSAAGPLVTRDESETRAVGVALGALARPGDIVLLTGDLGAGKTALSKGVAAGLGITSPVTSPTFNILLVYEGRLPLYHFDLYRLERAEELEDIDYFGTVEGDGISLVEWGDRFTEVRLAEHVCVTLAIVGDHERHIEFEGHGARGLQLADAWLAAARRELEALR